MKNLAIFLTCLGVSFVASSIAMAKYKGASIRDLPTIWRAALEDIFR